MVNHCSFCFPQRLEDTLIELYLSGYPSTACNAADDSLLPGEAEDKDGSMLISDGNDICICWHK